MADTQVEPMAPHTITINAVQTVQDFVVSRNISTSAIFLFLIFLLLLYKTFTITFMEDVPVFAAYSALIVLYILSRFGLAHFYNADATADYLYTPTVTFVTPAKNEGENIGHTLRAMLKSEYPREKIEII